MTRFRDREKFVDYLGQSFSDSDDPSPTWAAVNRAWLDKRRHRPLGEGGHHLQGKPPRAVQQPSPAPQRQEESTAMPPVASPGEPVKALPQPQPQPQLGRTATPHEPGLDLTLRLPLVDPALSPPLTDLTLAGHVTAVNSRATGPATALWAGSPNARFAPSLPTMGIAPALPLT